MSETKEKMMLDDSEKGSAVAPSVVVKEAGLEAQGIHVPRSGFFAKVRGQCYLLQKFFYADLLQMWQAVMYIDKFGVEVRGIERIRPEDRSARSMADLFDSATMYVFSQCTT